MTENIKAIEKRHNKLIEELLKKTKDLYPRSEIPNLVKDTFPVGCFVMSCNNCFLRNTIPNSRGDNLCFIMCSFSGDAKKRDNFKVIIKRRIDHIVELIKEGLPTGCETLNCEGCNLFFGKEPKTPECAFCGAMQFLAGKEF